MRFNIFLFGIAIFYAQINIAQGGELRIYLANEENGSPVADAHIFIDHSSIGTISDDEGYCQLRIPPHENQILIITHILYETVVLEPDYYLDLVQGDTLLMKSNNVKLSEVLVSANRGRLWKKNFNKFKRTLLGEDKAASKCKIINPEVLRFDETNGVLMVKAVDLLQIENDYLGYSLKFRLEELTINSDGSSHYYGNCQFTDKSDVNDKRTVKRRKNTYERSVQHFLRSLLNTRKNGHLSDFGYSLSIESYSAGKFTSVAGSIEPWHIVQPDSGTNLYRLSFSRFLTVTHLNIKESITNEVQVSVSQAEQQRFGSSGTQSLGGGVQNAVSRLYKIEPYLLFDRRGNIINKSAVREYGFWSKQRLAATLPIDYLSLDTIDDAEDAFLYLDTLQLFKDFVDVNEDKRRDALDKIRTNWTPSFIAPLLDIMRISQLGWHQESIRNLLLEKAAHIEPNYYEGIQSLWRVPANYGNYYGDLRAYLYKVLDPNFYTYFYSRQEQARVRLDEIIWGGVRQDGIPPLRSPNMISNERANFLSDSDLIFGIVINGEPRAYPQRILGWHEFLTDDLNGHSYAIVYCTLCGTAIAYSTEHQGVKFDLGTSGFLYRSNKLMYDQKTQSLWSTILGKPVFGPLVELDLELRPLPIETTTWGDWIKRFPVGMVLDWNTGYERDYAEGKAYKDYFSSDELMFPVPKKSEGMKNKARVFIPRPLGYQENPLAISVDYLKRERFYQGNMGEEKIIVVSEPNGSSRAFTVGDQKFKAYKNSKLVDSKGGLWKVNDDAIMGPENVKYPRIPGHEIFWFAWNNIFPQTRIVD